MSETNRGSIKYLERYKQSKLISYEGMERHRKITPTDIDGLIDYNGNSFVYIELKLKDTPIEYGQKKALENVINSHRLAGHFACAILGFHSTPSNEIIIAKDILVQSVYQNGKWREWIEYNQTLLQFLEYWENFCRKEKIEI